MMIPKAHKFGWGQQVIAQGPLYNDGSHPGYGPDELLVEQGTPGQVVQLGKHEETDTAVYLVEFAGQRIVGCLEHDIAAQ